MNISVCMATYNGERYIKEQLDSILPQLGSDDELIVSDDGSTDRTLDIVRAYNDPRIRIVKGPGVSLTCNFEHAFKQASGQYIFLSDQDDVWMPNKVKVMMGYLQNYDLVMSDAVVVDAQLNPIRDSYYSLMHSGRGFWKNYYRNTYLGSCMAFQSHLLRATLPFPKNIIMHDIWVALYADIKFHTIFIPDKLIKYRRHEGNASPSSTKSHLSLTFRIQYRLHLLYHLVMRIIVVDLHLKAE